MRISTPRTLLNERVTIITVWKRFFTSISIHEKRHHKSHQRTIPTLTHALDKSIEINISPACKVNFFKSFAWRDGLLDLTHLGPIQMWHLEETNEFNSSSNHDIVASLEPLRNGHCHDLKPCQLQLLCAGQG